MKMGMIYTADVLQDAGEEELELQIRVNRYEDLFEIYIDGKQVAYGDWSNNLLEILRDIVLIENVIADIKE
jgi:hypothetical protein